MANFFCGLDAGGTSTRAIVADARASQVGWGYASGANPNHHGWDVVGANLRDAVQAACQRAGCQIKDIRSFFLGVASVITKSDRESAAKLCSAWGVGPDVLVAADHDIRIALEGGLSGRPGIAVISGTGSSCYGRNGEGQSWQAGGWDQLLDDAGSGFDLGQRGMVAACQSADGRLGATSLKDLFFTRLGVTEVVEFAVKVHRPGLSRHEIAAFAPIVLQAAEDGDEVAVSIVSRGAAALARMVSAVSNRLFPFRNPEIVLLGGVLEKSTYYRAHVRQTVLEEIPHACFCEPESLATVGAWALAVKQTGRAVGAKTFFKIAAAA